MVLILSAFFLKEFEKSNYFKIDVKFLFNFIIVSLLQNKILNSYLNCLIFKFENKKF